MKPASREAARLASERDRLRTADERQTSLQEGLRAAEERYRVLLKQGDKTLAIPVDERAAVLVPFRGPGGVHGGSFRYVSASDVVLATPAFVTAELVRPHDTGLAHDADQLW